MNRLQQQWLFLRDHGVDKVLLVPTIGLMVIGFIMISSATIDVAAIKHLDPFYQSKRQLVFMLLGLLALAVSMFMPVHFWQKNSFMLMGLGALILLAV